MSLVATLLVATLLCGSVATADESTILCTYDGMRHYPVYNTVPNTPDLNKPDASVSGSFQLTFNNGNGELVKGYFWGIRPKDALTKSPSEQGNLNIVEINDDSIIINKYNKLFYQPSEVIDRKTGEYKVYDEYPSGLHRTKASGACRKSTLRPIPRNIF
jgi:hypothetical protein